MKVLFLKLINQTNVRNCAFLFEYVRVYEEYVTNVKVRKKVVKGDKYDINL